MENFLDSLNDYRETMLSLREIVLANLLMIGEIQAPTYKESRRIEFLRDRFSECDLQNACTDEIGNGLGILPGESGTKSILVVAHADTAIPRDLSDHSLNVQTDRIVGPGVADNSLGLAAVASLPTILEHLNIRFKSNLILMGAVRSLGRGNLEGLRFFLKHQNLAVSAGLCIEGIELGRLSYASIGMLRGDITCKVPSKSDWSPYGNQGAIMTLNEIITRISHIPTPQKPRTSIMFSSIQGGTNNNKPASRARLRFEIRSESGTMVHDIHKQLDDIVAETAYDSGEQVQLDIFAERQPGGIPFSHPMVSTTRKIMSRLGVTPRVSPSTSELSAFIDCDIPAVTLGITEGERVHEDQETIYIDPIFTGLAQVVGVLQAADNELNQEG